MEVLVTGGAGFIGSNFIHHWVERYPQDRVTNLDALTYAGHPESLRDLKGNPNYVFAQGDIRDEKAVAAVMADKDLVVHFAAESHVDRSVVGPMVFTQTNVEGTHVLLDAALKARVGLFHHVSTDEVFGSLPFEPKDKKFNEGTSFAPRTPYAASKAGSDLLVRAYFETYGLPVTTSNTSNNYGPYQDPEKLIPRFTTNLIRGQKVPLMGEGENVRDWIHVLDHCQAIDLITHAALANPRLAGETFCVGGNSERTNKQVTLALLALTGRDESFIQRVDHRLGHDQRYAIDSSKIKTMLGWEPQRSFEKGLKETVEWYKDNQWWWRPLLKNRPMVDRTAQKKYK